MRQVRASICKFEGRKSPYRVRWKPSNAKKYKTEWKETKKEANQRKKEIEEYENGNRDLSKELDFQEIREAQLKLKHTQNDRAKGKSISYAVDWFLENFQGGDEILELKAYYKEYQKIKKGLVTKHTLNSDQQLIGTKGTYAFINLYGEKKPTECSRKFLQKYIDEHESKFHRLKALRAFFNWMSGESSKYYNDSPCLVVDPMKKVILPKKYSDLPTEVATNQEFADLLKLTHSKEYNYTAARWAFMFFTGMRPSECERFWSSKDYGWNHVDFNYPPHIKVPKKFTRKRGQKERMISIRSGFLKMLKTFKSEGESKYPLIDVKNWKRKYANARKEIWGKRMTISSKRDDAKDITRHTFITNLHLYNGTLAEASKESGTSEQTLIDHYINTSCKITKSSAEYFFEKIDLSAFEQKIEVPKIKESQIEETIDEFSNRYSPEIVINSLSTEYDDPLSKSITRGKVEARIQKVLEKYREKLDKDKE